ncbi:hypothetical protein [uncultured Barnesiella sp.]|jgi:hypothetical protein|uniref:hypothetical protein n=1 Tax=uncultured Barnesiella sp. TaxID=584861 RepID=UPI00258EFEE0|nr:hypothetical protein [uncultured Barnesiella sp.]
MKKYIHITKEDRMFIMKALGVTERTVFNAIRFDSKRGDTELARKIRKLAMERGGIVMVVIPEIETMFDSDNYMRQYFPNGALLEISKDNGNADIYFKDEHVWHTSITLVSEIRGLQNQAMALK